MDRCAIVIVGFRCHEDIVECMRSIDQSGSKEYFVHICENGGEKSYDALVDAMSSFSVQRLPAKALNNAHVLTIDTTCVVQTFPGVDVFLHRAVGNLGYAGAINAVLDFLRTDNSWSAVWVLNPDTKPQLGALDALRARAQDAHYGIIGGRLVVAETGQIQMYGGRWRRWIARGWNIGRAAPADAKPDSDDVEREMDYVCGASMYVSRRFIEHVGNMEESYFLYGEEVDWCLRRGAFKLGYAHDAIVFHAHGATIGSNRDRKNRSSLSVYLDERSKILITKRFFPGIFPLVAISTLLLTSQYAVQGAFKNFGIALSGWLAGMRGEVGLPDRVGLKAKTPA